MPREDWSQEEKPAAHFLFCFSSLVSLGALAICATKNKPPLHLLSSNLCLCLEWKTNSEHPCGVSSWFSKMPGSKLRVCGSVVGHLSKVYDALALICITEGKKGVKKERKRKETKKPCFCRERCFLTILSALFLGLTGYHKIRLRGVALEGRHRLQERKAKWKQKCLPWRTKGSFVHASGSGKVAIQSWEGSNSGLLPNREILLPQFTMKLFSEHSMYHYRVHSGF